MNNYSEIASAARNKETGEITVTTFSPEDGVMILDTPHEILYNETYHQMVNEKHFLYQVFTNDRDDYVVGVLVDTIDAHDEGALEKRRAIGRNAAEEDLKTAFKVSPKQLAEFVIEYAANLGKTIEELTAAEKAEAFTIVAEKIEQIKGETIWNQ